jgi:hypothetical protein
MMNNLKRQFAKIVIALLLLSPIAAAQRPASTPRPNYGGGHHAQSHGGHYNGATNSHHKGGTSMSLSGDYASEEDIRLLAENFGAVRTLDKAKLCDELIPAILQTET